MFSLRVSRSELLERLNCDAYSPELLEAARVISMSGISAELLGDLVRSPINNSIRNIEGELDTPNTSVPMFRPADFDGAFVSVDTAPKVSKAFEARHQKARVYPGDLVLGIAGTIARAGMVPSGCEYGAVNGSCARIAPRIGSSGFLCAFLQSKYGYASLMRLAVGSVQKHLNLEDLPATPVPTPAAPAQTYIGDKVRQAERLRARARALLQEVASYHFSMIPPYSPSKSKWSSYAVTPSEIIDVVTPHFYPPSVKEYLSGRSTKTLGQLSTRAYSGQTYDGVDESGPGIFQATSRSCSGRFLSKPCNYVKLPKSNGLDLHTHDLIMTNAAHDKAYIGKDVTYFHGGDRTIPSAKVVVIRPDRKQIPASYLHVYLQQRVGYIQLQSAIRGISAGIRAEDIENLSIPIPSVDPSAHEEWMANDDKMVQAGLAEDHSRILTTAAKLLVEALIEGAVSEADLVAAQKALEANDRSADRAILQRLTRKGMDAASEPALFPNLDALYDALDALDGREGVEG